MQASVRRRVGITGGQVLTPMRRRNPDLIDALRATLRQVEASEQLSRDDDNLANLKRQILLTLADLEREENGESAAA